MTLTMTCKHCGKTIDAQDEDGLVTGVQAHARTHEGGPDLTRGTSWPASTASKAESTTSRPEETSSLNTSTYTVD